MGAIISRFRKEKTTYQILENLEIKIKDIEEYSLSTQEKQKRVVGNFLVISIGALVIALVTFYFVFFPETWEDRLKYFIPIVLSPVLIYVIKRIFAWYYQRKLNSNCRKLNKLRAEKKKIIEKVMETETYKVALEILNKFGDKSQLRSNTMQTPRINTAAGGAITPAASRTTPRPNQLQPRQLIAQLNRTPNSNPSQNIMQTLNQSIISSVGVTPISPSQLSNPLASINRGVRTPYPIIDENSKGVLEKMVDFLIGDGPNNRYAMICKECLRHNGMTSQEDFEYAAFRCAFCNALNPSRKIRPAAPRLPDMNNTIVKRQFSESSEPDRESQSSDDVAEKATASGGVEPQTNDNIETSEKEELLNDLESKEDQVLDDGGNSVEAETKPLENKKKD